MIDDKNNQMTEVSTNKNQRLDKKFCDEEQIISGELH